MEEFFSIFIFMIVIVKLHDTQQTTEFWQKLKGTHTSPPKKLIENKV